MIHLIDVKGEVKVKFFNTKYFFTLI